MKMKFTDSLNVDTDLDDAAIQRNSKGLASQTRSEQDHSLDL